MNLEGHYGNKLLLVKAHIIGDSATEISRAILLRLGGESKSMLLSQLERYLDEHDALYIRLNRQRIPEQLSLTDDESIRIKLKPRSRILNRKAMLQKYSEMIRL